MAKHATDHRGPDRDAALAQYRRRAPWYDLELALFEPIRREAITQLELQPGQTVLDVGCGTGLSLPALQRGVGPRGAIVGIEQSPEMIARARQRVAQNRWDNVALLCAPVETARIAVRADAALLHFTHDIMRRPEAITHVLAHLVPGARIVASGLKWVRGLGFAANAFVLPAALRSVSSLDGLGEPWSELAARVGGLDVRSLWFGAVYIATARVASATTAARPAR